jgi:hypothetical protein
LSYSYYWTICLSEQADLHTTFISCNYCTGSIRFNLWWSACLTVITGQSASQSELTFTSHSSVVIIVLVVLYLPSGGQFVIQLLLDKCLSDRANLHTTFISCNYCTASLRFALWWAVCRTVIHTTLISCNYCAGSMKLETFLTEQHGF